MNHLIDYSNRIFSTFILVLALGVPFALLAQDSTNVVGNRTYGKFGDYWFVVKEGRQGNLVDLRRIVVQPQKNGYIDNFDFSQYGLPVLEQNRSRFAGNFYELIIPENLDPFDVHKKIYESGFFDVVHFSYIIPVHSTPNDTYFGNQWGFTKAQLTSAWNMTTGSSDVLVAIIDSGVEYDHDDLEDNIWDQIGDGFNGDNDPEPDYHEYHGTAVAGIVAAVTNNSTGVAGIAGGWSGSGGIRIMVMDVGYYAGYPYDAEMIDVAAAAEATDSAAVWGAKVINMSFGGASEVEELEAAINNAVNNYDVVVVCSAGNNGGDSSPDKTIRYPARYSNTIAVGASNDNDQRWTTAGVDGSAYGSQLDVVAPGGVSTIWTTDISGAGGYDGGDYTDSFGGTSASAPFVSGIAALIRSKFSSLTQEQVRSSIQLSADDKGTAGKDDYYGYGRVNAYKAVYNLYVPQAYSTIQTAIDNATSDQEVWVSYGTGTYTEEIDMKNGVDVKSVSTIPTINGTVDFDEADCELEDFKVNEAITISNSYVTLDGIESTKSSGTAVSISNYSLVDIVDFKSDDGADVGIYSYYDNEVYLDGIQIENTENDYNNGKAIHQPTYDYMEVYDFYFCNNDSDIVKYYSADIYLDEYCTFTDSPPLVCIGVREVEYPTNYYICSQQKAYDPNYNNLTKTGSSIILQKTDENEAYNLGMNLLRQINRQRLAAIQADFDVKGQDFAKEYTEAIGLLKQAVAESNEETLIRTAIGRIISSYFQLNQNENAYNYLTSLKENSKHTSLLPIINGQLINYYLRQDDPQTALKLVNDLLAMSLNEEEQAAFLNLKAFIYWKHLNDPDQAILCYQEVMTNFSGTPSSEFALAQLEMLSESIPDAKPTAPEKVEELVLEGYPNPFNPTATVRFSLPKAGDVTLIVYDMLGREVVKLIDGFHNAGRYELIWDGRDSKGLEVSTGIYITKLSTPLETKVIRMLMVK